LRLTVAVYLELLVSAFIATKQPKTYFGAAAHGNKPNHRINLLILSQRGP
jgi:hypothetical protein